MSGVNPQDNRRTRKTLSPINQRPSTSASASTSKPIPKPNPKQLSPIHQRPSTSASISVSTSKPIPTPKSKPNQLSPINQRPSTSTSTSISTSHRSSNQNKKPFQTVYKTPTELFVRYNNDTDIKIDLYLDFSYLEKYRSDPHLLYKACLENLQFILSKRLKLKYEGEGGRNFIQSCLQEYEDVMVVTKLPNTSTRVVYKHIVKCVIITLLLDNARFMDKKQIQDMLKTLMADWYKVIFETFNTLYQVRQEDLAVTAHEMYDVSEFIRTVLLRLCKHVWTTFDTLSVALLEYINKMSSVYESNNIRQYSYDDDHNYKWSRYDDFILKTLKQTPIEININTLRAVCEKGTKDENYFVYKNDQEYIQMHVTDVMHLSYDAKYFESRCAHPAQPVTFYNLKYNYNSVYPFQIIFVDCIPMFLMQLQNLPATKHQKLCITNTVDHLKGFLNTIQPLDLEKNLYFRHPKDPILYPKAITYQMCSLYMHLVAWDMNVLENLPKYTDKDGDDLHETYYQRFAFLDDYRFVNDEHPDVLQDLIMHPSLRFPLHMTSFLEMYARYQASGITLFINGFEDHMMTQVMWMALCYKVDLENRVTVLQNVNQTYIFTPEIREAAFQTTNATNLEAINKLEYDMYHRHSQNMFLSIKTSVKLQAKHWVQEMFTGKPVSLTQEFEFVWNLLCIDALQTHRSDKGKSDAKNQVFLIENLYDLLKGILHIIIFHCENLYSYETINCTSEEIVYLFLLLQIICEHSLNNKYAANQFVSSSEMKYARDCLFQADTYLKMYREKYGLQGSTSKSEDKDGVVVFDLVVDNKSIKQLLRVRNSYIPSDVFLNSMPKRRSPNNRAPPAIHIHTIVSSETKTRMFDMIYTSKNTNQNINHMNEVFITTFSPMVQMDTFSDLPDVTSLLPEIDFFSMVYDTIHPHLSQAQKNTFMTEYKNATRL
jgi:hypothetical protein